MNYILTTCCKDKDTSKGLMPAIKRYLNPRIGYVYGISKSRGIPMLIFSGKFGILKPEEKIPYYDLRLEKGMVFDMTNKVINQLKTYKIDEICFYGLDENKHPDWQPYYSVIEKVCTFLNIKLKKAYLNKPVYE
ncbi:MAG: hypothetical protein ABIG91_02505 [Patescibacteria group bacterium]